MQLSVRASAVSALALVGAGASHAQPNAPAGSPAPEVVVVTGSEGAIEAARAELARVAGGTSLIDVAELGERSVANMADALRYVPGVWSVSPTGDDNIWFTSRGSNLDAIYYDMNGIKLLQDGLPVTTAGGDNHNRMIDPLAARYATIARGANAVSFGASTLGGAVNFVTPTASDGTGSSVSLTGGSHGLTTGRLTLGRTFGDTGDALVTIEGKTRDGYREHNEQDRGGLYVNAGWQFTENWSTRFYLTVVHNDSELTNALTRAQFDADPDRAVAATVGNYQIDVDTTRLANKSVWRIDDERSLEFGFSFEEQSLFHPIVWSPFFSLLIDRDHSDAGAMARYRQRIGDHELVFGLNHGDSDVSGGHFSHVAAVPTELWARIETAATTTELFALDRWAISDQTTLVLAVQAVSAGREAMTIPVLPGPVSHPQASYNRINPRLGAIHDLGTGLSLYGNLSSLYEPPTTFQLQDNVAGGDATLKAMQGSVLEIGLRGEGGGANGSFNWDVALYHAAIDDEILSIDDPMAPGTSLSTNIDNTVHAGIEAIFRSSHRVGGRGGLLEPLVSMTVNDFAFDGDAIYGNNELPGAPDYFVKGELIYRSPDGFFAGPTFDHVGARWADFSNSYRVAGYTLLGLRGGYARNRWRTFVDIRNVSDKDYVAYHSVRDVAAPDSAVLYRGEPLSAYIGFEFSLD
jgi:iron complex outermembrane receptor protein